MTRIATVVATSLVLVIVWAGVSTGQPGRNKPNEPTPPTAEPQQHQEQQTKPREPDRDRVVVTANHIPSFIQAGRTYAFQPVGGAAFSGKIVTLDATGWVQVQLRPGLDVGRLAEWFNLDSMLSVKAMN